MAPVHIARSVAITETKSETDLLSVKKKSSKMIERNPVIPTVYYNSHLKEEEPIYLEPVVLAERFRVCRSPLTHLAQGRGRKERLSNISNREKDMINLQGHHNPDREDSTEEIDLNSLQSGERELSPSPSPGKREEHGSTKV
jgi:hypothetical protein